MTRSIFIAGVLQETNSFSSIATTLESFAGQAYRPSKGIGLDPKPDLLAYGGAVAAVREAGHVAIEGPFCSAVPAAPAAASTWARLKQDILEDLLANAPVDAIVLFPHGAQSAQGIDDCEGDLLQAIRAHVGRKVPIAVALDLHANLSEAMLRNADIVLSCKHYPHIDFPEAGAQAARLAMAAAEGKIMPKTIAARISAVGVSPTTTGAAKALREEMTARECQIGTGPILALSALYGFFGADSPDTGASAVVVYDAARSSMTEPSEQLAWLAGALRSAILTDARPTTSISQALGRASEEIESGRRPVIIADRSDNPGGGAAGDTTHLLKALLERGLDDCVVGVIWDPQAVDACHRAGEGARATLSIGGKADALSGGPIVSEVEIVSCRDDVAQARFGVGQPSLPLGRSARVRVAGVDVILAEIRGQVFDRRPFTEHGIDLAACRMIVVKSTNHFRAAYETLGPIIDCDAPGGSSLALDQLPYRQVRRPLWPLDADPPGIEFFGN